MTMKCEQRFIMANYCARFISWMEMAQFRCSLFKSKFMSTHWLRTTERLLVNCFCRWNGQVTGSKSAYRQATSPSQSTFVLAFHLIGALSFHFADCPHKRRALISNSNDFPIMQMISPQKISTPGAHQFNKASSLNTCVPPLFSTPPNSSRHTSEKVYFWCIALVFTLLWWGNRKSS